MSLSDKWINRLFAVLGAIYGSKFADMWAGADPEVMKQVWAEKLAGFAHRPDIIRGALNDCDDLAWPPTLPEFIGMCRSRARRMSPAEFALPAPELRKLEHKEAE